MRKPHTDISVAEVVFPAEVHHLMPEWDDIPEEYKKGVMWANRLFGDWFFVGLSSLDLPWKEDIDPDDAMRHIRTVMGSYQPSHEHKEAAVAYLIDLWTEGEGSWTVKERT